MIKEIPIRVSNDTEMLIDSLQESIDMCGFNKTVADCLSAVERGSTEKIDVVVFDLFFDNLAKIQKNARSKSQYILNLE